MESAAAYTVENLLDFSSDVGEEDLSSSSTTTTTTTTINHPSSFPEEYAEEELEWLSNKDAFPSVDTFVDTFTISDFKHLSPTSVLDSNKNNSNSSIVMSCCFAVPVRRARTKGRKKTRHCDRLTDLSLHQLIMTSYNQENINTNNNMVRKSSTHGRKCQHCLTDKTPQWRAGPMGPKTLCNACGVRYKSGRLVPEYRPANSPTFSSKLHSNSHRKVVEMRKRKEVGNVLVNCHVDIG